MLNDHDEESDQVHVRLRRDAVQDRRLIIKDTIPSTRFTQFWRFTIYVYEESDQGYGRNRRNAE